MGTGNIIRKQVWGPLTQRGTLDLKSKMAKQRQSGVSQEKASAKALRFEYPWAVWLKEKTTIQLPPVTTSPA